MATRYVQDSADFDSGGAPVAGDIVVITGKDTGNSTNIDTNIDKSTLGAGGLADLFVSHLFRGDLGSLSIPFKAEINHANGSKTFRNAAASGFCYYTPAGNSNVCDKVRQSGRGTLRLVGATGTVNNLEQIDGTVTVAQGITPTTVRIAGGEMLIDGAAGTSPTTLNVGGSGLLRTLREFTTLNLFDRGLCKIDVGSDAISTINIYGGGLEIIGSGTITTLNFYAGDANNIRIGRLTTITTINVWPTVRNVSRFLHHAMLTFTTVNWEVDKGERNV